MCGIISYFSTDHVYKQSVAKTLSELVMANTVRGYHSTGMFFESVEDTPDILKKAIPGYDFVELPVVDRIFKNHDKIDFLIAHNRAATKGVVNSNNAHPFQHGNITGVHNGTLASWRHLTTGNFDTDSEHIIKAISVDGADKVIPKLNGSFNLIWHDSDDNTMHLCRNDDRKYVFGKVKNSNTIMGASEPQMLYWVAGRNGINFEEDLWYPDPMTEYIFSLDKDLNEPRRVKHEEYKTVTYYGSGSRYNNNSSNNSLARKKDTTTFVFTTYERYSTSNELGKFIGKDTKGEKVMLFGAKRDAYKFNQAYEGTCYSSVGGYRSVDTNSAVKKKVKDVKVSKNSSKRTKVQCIGCSESIKIKEMMFVDNAPVCLDCFETFELSKQENVEVIPGTDFIN